LRGARALNLAIALLLVGLFAVPAARAQEGDLGFSPASGHAAVIAQGVVDLPSGDVVWRTIRTRAALPADAPFERHDLGFVLASAGPLLITDQQTGEQTQLGLGEATLVREGAVQQRASLADQPVGYLSIELVPANAAPPPADATVLQPGQPFAAPGGRHDLDLVSDTLQGDEVFTIPDSGAKNVVLITDGAAAVGRPGGNPVVLLAGEAASFSGELQVAVAPDGNASGGEQRVSFVVAMIGPEIPAPPAAATPAPMEGEQGASTPALDRGSISVQVFTCPPGMTAETLSAAACAPATGVFDVTISSDALSAPLTLGDAASEGETLTWGDLPFGDYVIAEAVLPEGYTTYELAAKTTSGSAETGFRVALDAENPTLSVRIYNFAPA
jgi:hypothetical protein